MRKYFSAGTRSMPLAYISQSSSHVTFECVSNVTTPPAYTSRTRLRRRDDLNFVTQSLFRFVVTLLLSLFLSLSLRKRSLYSSSVSSSDDVIQSVGFVSENLTFQPPNHRCGTALKLPSRFSFSPKRRDAFGVVRVYAFSLKSSFLCPEREREKGNTIDY